MEPMTPDEDFSRRRRPPARKRSPRPAVVAAVIIAGALGWWLYPREALPPEAETPPPQVLPMQVDESDAMPRFPIAEPVSDESEPEMLPLQELGDSDAAVIEALAGLLAAGELERIVVPEFVISRVVASVDNLPRTSLPARMHPVRPVPGRLQVDAGDPETIAAANAARYQARIEAMESVDPAALVDVYVRWYPRFQQAYRELGYPGAHFNDRLVEVVDHLLAAPEVSQPVTLRATQRGYEYADPAMEAASVGHRAMWRMGPDNAARAKSWLQSLRSELVSRGAPADGPG